MTIDEKYKILLAYVQKISKLELGCAPCAGLMDSRVLEARDIIDKVK